MIGRQRVTLVAAPRCQPITAVGLLPLPREEFRQLRLILHSELRRRAASRRALPCPSSIKFNHRPSNSAVCSLSIRSLLHTIYFLRYLDLTVNHPELICLSETCVKPHSLTLLLNLFTVGLLLQIARFLAVPVNSQLNPNPNPNRIQKYYFPIFTKLSVHRTPLSLSPTFHSFRRLLTFRLLTSSRLITDPPK